MPARAPPQLPPFWALSETKGVRSAWRPTRDAARARRAVRRLNSYLRKLHTKQDATGPRTVDLSYKKLTHSDASDIGTRGPSTRQLTVVAASVLATLYRLKNHALYISDRTSVLH
jgi:hypothetical protein